MIKITRGNIFSHLGRFFKRINAPYRVNVINEETMQETLSMRLTKRSVYFFFSTVLVIIFLLITLLILFTPLRYYLPGNQHNVTRSELLRLQRLSDSLVKLNTLREQYIYNLIQVSSGRLEAPSDTNLLSETEIKKAERQNMAQIDHASNYDYLKNVKHDSLSNEDKVVKDTLLKK